jgi:GntR family transcriptional regulator
MIIGKGMEPGSKDTKFQKIAADKQLAKKLNLTPGDPVISLTRVRTANNSPVAYTIDFLPLALVPENFSQDFKSGSLYIYMEERLGLGLSNSMLKIHPIKAPNSIARRLEIKQGDLLLLLEQTDTSTDNVPMLYSEEYFVADRFEFIVYRRRKKIW